MTRAMLDKASRKCPKCQKRQAVSVFNETGKLATCKYCGYSSKVHRNQRWR